MITTATVHLIFKTHLDIGFSDSAANVVETYLWRFIPQAIALAHHTRESGNARFRWTVGAWLMYQYLERATPGQRHEMEQAVEAGDILWHALPFTTHTELIDASLFRHGLSYSQRLDHRFGRATICAKMTDVPGHTRAMVPLLAEAGIRMLHIGVNEASSVPDVPPVFTWRDVDTGAEVMVVYDQSYGGVTQVPGLSDALALVLTDDNYGPPSEAAINETYRAVADRVPGSRVVASSLDDFARALDTVRGSLPVITSEIGDTWIHGGGSDPTKVRRYRELSRLRREWLSRPLTVDEQARIDAFSDQLLMVPEHSWSMDEKTHLADYTHYEAADLAHLRKTERCRRFEASWAEQRGFIDAALTAVAGTALGAEAELRLARTEPGLPDLTGLVPTDDYTLRTAQFELEFDRDTGAITQLHHLPSSSLWADSEHPLALMHYETFGQEDYDRFWQQYIRNKDDERVRWWAREDFTKPGLPTQSHREWTPRVLAAYRSGEDQLLFELLLPEESHHFGAPARLYLEYKVPADDPDGIEVALLWFNKPACRLPEAFWLSFCPVIEQPGGWRFEKMGRLIDPGDVISRGGRELHAIDQKVIYRDGAHLFELTLLDAPLVAPGQSSLLNFHDQLPDMRRGVHVNLYNNVWGTNFPMWFEDDTIFRFRLKLE